MDKAEACLLKLREALQKPSMSSNISDLSEEFYQLLPHKPEHKLNIAKVKDIARKQDLCQVSDPEK